MRWIGTINLALAGVILLTTALFIFSGKEDDSLTFIPRPEQKELPKSPFSETEEFFQEVGEGFFALNWIPPQMQLPDLRHELLFYGKNLRPDSLMGRGSFHFALKGSDERALIRENERAYLVYQGNYSSKEFKRNLRNSHPESTSSSGPLWGEISKPASDLPTKNSYTFSPGNQATPLWFEVKSLGDQTIEVRVSMLDEKGTLVTTPQEYCHFHCQPQEFPKGQMMGWDLGGYRVDSTLLVRQKARWIGSDLFLSLHGGDEFSHVLGKERIDFFDTDRPYSCFVAAGDFLTWKEGRWVVVGDKEETQHHPLMVVKKIDDKIISLELWDSEGRGRTLLSLIRSREHYGKPNISQEMKFVGAKTWAQFIVECRNGVRMTLKLHDWLVLTQEGWQKLDSPDQIDAYVNQTLIGPLFILDKMIKQNGSQVLIGHLFNTSRTEVEQVELTSSSSASSANFCRHVPMNPPTLTPSEEGGGE